MGVNIAIDGTAGSGKGFVSKALAKKLGFYHLDTGAIYRSVAYFILNKKIALENFDEIEKAIKNIDFKIEFEKDKNNNQIQKNILFSEDLKDNIRTEEVSFASSFVAQVPKVREFATRIQHEIASAYDIIIEGRDIGTVVLPNANYKFFLTALPEVRARRRLNQLNLSEDHYKNILEEILNRDERDMNRKLSPLKRAKDAIIIDNSDQTPEETINLILSYIKL